MIDMPSSPLKDGMCHIGGFQYDLINQETGQVETMDCEQWGPHRQMTDLLPLKYERRSTKEALDVEKILDIYTVVPPGYSAQQEVPNLQRFCQS